MHCIEVDAATWRSADDLWNSVLAGLEAPAWHGKNLDALWDTVTEGARHGVEFPQRINGIQPPFAIVVANPEKLSKLHHAKLRQIAKLLEEARTEYDLDVSLKM